MNKGCVPKKIMYNCSRHAEAIADHSDYGFDLTLNGFSWKLVNFLSFQCKYPEKVISYSIKGKNFPLLKNQSETIHHFMLGTSKIDIMGQC